jgi:hypothetical protein
MDLTGFDANTVEPNAPREIWPAGWYKGVIVESEEVATKAQTGSFLQLKIECVEGPMQGRTLTDRLNLNNPNEVAEKIAQGTLSAICRAVGVMVPKNSSDLHDKPLMFMVKVRPAQGEYGPQNEVAGYEDVKKKKAGPNGPAPVAAAAAEPEAAPAGAKTPPWRKGKK